MIRSDPLVRESLRVVFLGVVFPFVSCGNVIFRGESGFWWVVMGFSLFVFSQGVSLECAEEYSMFWRVLVSLRRILELCFLFFFWDGSSRF